MFLFLFFFFHVHNLPQQNEYFIFIIIIIQLLILFSSIIHCCVMLEKNICFYFIFIILWPLLLSNRKSFISSPKNCSFLIYKSQTAVAIFKSFSSACLTLINTLLLYFPLDSNRTDVTPQKIACSGPLTSDFPHMPDDLVI